MRGMTKKIWFGVAVLCACCSVSALNLTEAVLLAEHHDAGFMAAQAQYEADRAAVGVSRGSLLPAVTFSSSLARTKTSIGPVTGEATNRAWSLQMNQALFDLAAYDRYRSSQHLSLASYQQLRLAWMQLVMRTAQAYFDVLSARLSLSAILLSERATYQHYLMAKRNFDIGNSSIVDVLQAKSSLDSISAQRIQATQDLSVKRITLIHLIGVPLDHLHPLRSHLVYPRLDRVAFFHLLTDADQYAPQILAAAEGEKVASWLQYAAHAAHLPRLSLGLSRDVTRRPGQQPMTPVVPNYSTTVGLQLNWTVFAGGAMSASSDQAGFLHEKAFQQWIAARRQTFLSLETNYALYQSARAQEQAYVQAVLSAETLLQAVTVGYEAGNNSMLDLLDAEKQVSTLRQQWVQSQLSALLAYLQVKVTAGVLSLHDIQWITHTFFIGAPLVAAHEAYAH